MNSDGATMNGVALLVGVVGAGVMGGGVAEAVAGHGHRVVLLDLDDKILDVTRSKIARKLKADALMNAARRQASSDILGRISFTTDYAGLANADFIIENVSEITSAKRQVYASLDKVCPSNVIFAVNTSTFPITEVAGFVTHPERVVGMHFMNPVPSKPLVEVIRGLLTSDDTIQASMSFLAAIGKQGIVVEDAPGFVSNRVLMMTINEAVRTVQDGTSTAENVDKIFVGCFGHQMGPLATADLIGLDTIVLSLESLRDRLRDTKYEPVELLKSMVEANQLGRKTGHGFFDYF